MITPNLNDQQQYVNYQLRLDKKMPPGGGIYGEEQKRNLGAHFIIWQIGCQNLSISVTYR
jgi:hypothetical protein